MKLNFFWFQELLHNFTYFIKSSFTTNVIFFLNFLQSHGFTGHACLVVYNMHTYHSHSRGFHLQDETAFRQLAAYTDGTKSRLDDTAC